MAQKGITRAGYLLRYTAAAVLVFASYNPSYSYFHWFRDMRIGGIDPLVIFTGIILLIGWTIFLRATIRSLGAFGLTLAFAFFGTFIWMLIYWNLVSVDSIKTMVYLIEVVLVGVLGTGISWSHIRRRMTGQVDVDEVEGDV